MSCAKTAEPIEIPFSMLSWVDPRKHVFVGVQMLQQEGAKHRILGDWVRQGRCAEMGATMLTVYMSCHVFLHKEVLFGGHNVTAAHLG